MYRFFLSLATLILLSNVAVAATVGNGTVWNKDSSVHWSGVPLRESLDRFAEAQQIGVFLDRRVDPSTPLEFEVVRQPIAEILDGLATSLKLGYCSLGLIAYIGPKRSAAVLSRIVADQQQLPASLKRKTPLTISFLSVPREILEELAAKNGFRWENLDLLPHDLWPERTLPPTPLNELLSLILIGFDLTFESENNGKTLRIVPISFDKYIDDEPKTEKGDKSEPKKQTATKKVPLARKRFTLTFKDQKLDAVLNSLAERLELTLEIDDQSLETKGVSKKQPVSLDIKNATAQEMFRKLLTPLSLEFSILGDSLRIK